MQSSYYKITCLVIARAPAGPQGHSGRGDGAKRYWVMPGAARPTFVIFLTKVGQKKRNTGLSGVAGYGSLGLSINCTKYIIDLAEMQGGTDEKT